MMRDHTQIQMRSQVRVQVRVQVRAHLKTWLGLLAILFCLAPLALSQDKSLPPSVPQRPVLLPSAEPYRLQPGDTVTISFRFTPEFNDEVVIGPDGRVMLKSAGEIRLAGLSLSDAQREIVRDSESKLVKPEVTVSLKDFDRPHVIVAGEVQTPGKFELRKPTTVLQAILMAGGPKDDGAMGRVLLFRKLNSEMAEVHRLQLGNYRSKDRAKNDMILQPDDMILVRHDNISIAGRYVRLANVGVYFNPFANLF